MKERIEWFMPPLNIPCHPGKAHPLDYVPHPESLAGPSSAQRRFKQGVGDLSCFNDATSDRGDLAPGYDRVAIGLAFRKLR